MTGKHLATFAVLAILGSAQHAAQAQSWNCVVTNDGTVNQSWSNPDGTSGQSTTG